MPAHTRQFRAEFTAHLDATGLDRRLRAAHHAMGALALIGCLALLWRQFGLPVAAVAVWQRQIALSLGVGFLACGMIATSWAQERQYRRLTAIGDGVRQRADVVSAHVLARDGLLLGLSLGGQTMAWCATWAGIRLLSADVLIVLLPLLPTAQLAWFGWREVPTRARLHYLYKLVALYSERQQKTRTPGE
jgi:hypothetical protein